MLLALACAMPLSAQLEDAGSETKAKCEEFLRTPLPAEALSVAAPKAWPDCDSYKSYSGIGRKVDFAAARQCAWLERLAQQSNLESSHGIASVFGGSAMLTALYANGEGVQKSIPLAIRFACEAGGAPAEISLRVEHLQSLEAGTSKPDSAFDFCDDVTSGFMEGYCAAYESEIEDQKSAISLEGIASHFTPAQRFAFDTLRKSEEAYSLAHARGEIDLSGSARAMYEIDSEETLRENFLAALKVFEKGKYPAGSQAQFADANTRLNRAYRKDLSDAEEHEGDYGAVQPGGIRDAERAWLKYRDAWVAFARLRYPSVPADAWLVLLTNDRIAILDGSFCDMDVVEGPCVQKGDTWKPSPLP